MSGIPSTAHAFDAHDFAQAEALDARQTPQHQSLAVPLGTPSGPSVAGKFHEAKQIERLVDAQQRFVGRLQFGQHHGRPPGVHPALGPPLDAAQRAEAPRAFHVEGPALVVEFAAHDAGNAQGDSARQDGPIGPQTEPFERAGDELLVSRVPRLEGQFGGDKGGCARGVALSHKQHFAARRHAAVTEFHRLPPARSKLMQEAHLRAGDLTQTVHGVERQGAVEAIPLVEEAHHAQLVNVPGVFEEQLRAGGLAEDPLGGRTVLPTAVHGAVRRE